MGKFADRLQKYFAETPQEVLDREWERVKSLNDIGPDVVAYAERIKTFYGTLTDTTLNIVSDSYEPFMAESKYYLAA